MYFCRVSGNFNWYLLMCLLCCNCTILSRFGKRLTPVEKTFKPAAFLCTRTLKGAYCWVIHMYWSFLVLFYLDYIVRPLVGLFEICTLVICGPFIACYECEPRHRVDGRTHSTSYIFCVLKQFINTQFSLANVYQ